MAPKRSGRKAPGKAPGAAAALNDSSVLQNWRASIDPADAKQSELVSPIDDDVGMTMPVPAPRADDADSIISNARATTPDYVPAAERVGLGAAAEVLFEFSSSDEGDGKAAKKHRPEKKGSDKRRKKR